MSLKKPNKKVICKVCGSSKILNNKCLECGSDINLHIKKKKIK